MDVLDLLLKNELPKPETKEYKVKRLSKAFGEDFILQLRTLPYSKVVDIKEIGDDEVDLHIMMAGVVVPNLKNEDLMEKHGAVTPAELVKKIFTPGEIEDISRAVERLCGYRTNTIEEIKKK